MPTPDLSERLRGQITARSAPRGASPWREAVAVLILAAVCCVFFWQAVTLQGVFFHYDHAVQNYPYRLFFARGLGQGRLPLWTGDIFCGFPLFAESQGNALYPPFFILFGLLEPWIAYNYYHVLHFFLAGLFTYVLARVMRVGRAGALVAGVCYMLSGPVLYHAHHTNIVVAVCWLPLLLALMELACRRRSPLPMLGFAAATGALVLGAHPQYTLYCALACGLYLLWRLRLIQLTGGQRRRMVVLAVSLGLAAVLGAVLVSVQVLPLAELVRHGSRAAEVRALPGLSPGVPSNLITLFLPHYFGSPGLGSYWGNVDEGLYVEVMLFVGVVPLMLAAVGALSDRSRRALFFAGFGALAFIFSLGFSGSLYNAFWAVPLFSSARFPSRFAFVTALCVAMLAGMGLEQLLAAADRARVRRAAMVSAALVLVLSVLSLALAAAYHADLMPLGRAELARVLPLRPFPLEVMWRHLHHTLPADVWRLVAAGGIGAVLLLLCARRALPARAVAGLWCVLVFVELGFAGREFNPVTDPSIYRGTPDLVTALRELPPGRVFCYRYYDSRLPASFADFPHTRGWALRPQDYARSLDRLPHNANMIWGIPFVNGFSPLQTMALKTLLGQPENSSTMIEHNLSPALNLLGARYILSPHEEIPGEFEHIRKVGAINIFHNPDALPRAFIVHRARRAPRPGVTVAMLRSEGFDYRAKILVHDPSAPLLSLEPGGSDPAESADIIEDRGDTIAIRARLERPGYLVLADQYYPGWHVEVDGRKGELLRVDYLLKGVKLDAGEHLIRFVFRPASFRIGLVLSLCGLGLLLGGMLVCLVRKRSLSQTEGGEREALLAAPYTRRVARFVVVTGVLFLALGPAVRPYLWNQARFQLDPRRYVLCNVVSAAAYHAMGEEFLDSYELVRNACQWWPESEALRRHLVNRGYFAVQELLKDGQMARAQAMAAEIAAMAPEEMQEIAPSLASLARRERSAPAEAP